MADIVKIVDPDNGTGTDYTSLSAWEAQNLDLVTAGDTETASCRASSGSADTTAVILSGWTTDSTHDVTVQQADSDAHGGKYNTNVYRLEILNGYPIEVASDDVSLIGLQILLTLTGTTGYRYAIFWDDALISDGATTAIKKLIIVCDNQGTGTGMVAINGSTYLSGGAKIINLIVRNTLVYGAWDTQSIKANGADWHVVWESNTVYGGNKAFFHLSGDANSRIYNNISRSAATAGFSVGAVDADYNSSDISGDAPNTGGSGNDNTVSPWYSGATADSAIFTDAPNDDYHLKGSGTIFDSVGANLYSSFTTDYEGDARPNSAFDLGADEYVASGTVYNESISLATSAALTKSAGLILDESVALSTAAGMTPENNNVLNLALSLTAGAEILQSSIMDIMESIGLAASAGITPLATLIMSAAATLAATAGMSQEGVVSGGGTIYEEAIALATSAGMTPEIALSINGALALSASAGITQALTMAIESNLSLQTAAAMNQDNALDINESVSLAALATQTQSSTWSGNVSLVLSVAAHMIQLGLVGDAVVFAHEAVLNLAGSKSDLNLVKSKHDLEN